MLDMISALPRTEPVRLAGSIGAGAPNAANAGDSHGDFSSMIGAALGDLSERLRSAEAVSISGIRGHASTQQVVEQVMAAEQSLQMAIAVRDKIVSAYLEISRMPI